MTERNRPHIFLTGSRHIFSIFLSRLREYRNRVRRAKPSQHFLLQSLHCFERPQTVYSLPEYRTKRIRRALLTVMVLHTAGLFFCQLPHAGELADIVWSDDWTRFRQLLAQSADVNEGNGVQRTPSTKRTWGARLKWERYLSKRGRTSMHAPDDSSGQGPDRDGKTSVQKGVMLMQARGDASMRRDPCSPVRLLVYKKFACESKEISQMKRRTENADHPRQHV